jgi:hypothetical protein
MIKNKPTRVKERTIVRSFFMRIAYRVNKNRELLSHLQQLLTDKMGFGTAK